MKKSKRILKNPKINIEAIILVITLLSSISVVFNYQLPSWNMPVLKPWDLPAGGAEPLPNRQYIQLFKATPEVGTYNMSPMISLYNGMYLASWKNSPTDEDQPGQRVLYSQSQDGKNWTAASSGERVLFPNISLESSQVALFAEPTLLLNGRVYAAASPIQFCLYPDQYQSQLLLREVYEGYDSFGPIFWASYAVPSGYESNSEYYNISTLGMMSQQIQNDVSLLNQTDPTYRPCDPTPYAAHHSPKCEYCPNGCQLWSDIHVPSIENERSHYMLPNGGDVILYRDKSTVPNHLWASVRSQPGDAWPPILKTNITDDVANLNAGNLLDGRAYLVSNALVNYDRNPLYLSITDETNLRFVETHVIANCHDDTFQPFGCFYRYKGGGKQSGCQYPQALISNYDYFFTIFSLNKEDIYLVVVPLAEISKQYPPTPPPPSINY